MRVCVCARAIRHRRWFYILPELQHKMLHAERVSCVRVRARVCVWMRRPRICIALSIKKTTVTLKIHITACHMAHKKEKSTTCKMRAISRRYQSLLARARSLRTIQTLAHTHPTQSRTHFIALRFVLDSLGWITSTAWSRRRERERARENSIHKPVHEYFITCHYNCRFKLIITRTSFS